MGQLGRFVRFWFGVQAIGLIASVPSAVLLTFALFRWGRVDGYSLESFPGGPVIWAALSVLLDALPAVAWWQLKKGRPRAQAWALAASVASLPIPFPGRSIFRISVGPMEIVDTIAGIGGLIAFASSRTTSAVADSTAAQPERIAGDGTSKIADIIAAVIGIGGLFVTYALWSGWGRRLQLPTVGFVASLLLLQLAVTIAVIGHELGHFVTGSIAGMKLRHARVGPLAWSIRDAAWRFKFESAHLLGGGAVGMVSSNFSDMRAAAVMILGGPLGSLITAALAGIAAITAPGRPWESLWILFAMICSIALIDLVVNMIPQRPDGHYSDGAQFFQLLKKGPWAAIHQAFSMVASTLVSPMRPRDWDIDLIKRAADSVPTGERGAMLRIYLCMHYLETGRMSEAAARLEEAENLLDSPGVKPPEDCLDELAFYNAVCKRDLSRVEYWWNRAEAASSREQDAEYWSALAARRWLQGDMEAAEAAVEQGTAHCRKLPAAGAYDFDRWRFDCLRELMSEALVVQGRVEESAEPV